MPKIFDAIIRAAGASESVLWWRSIGIHLSALFGESSPPSLNRAITFVSPYVPWYRHGLNTKKVVARWAAAASAVPYSEELCRNAVDTLLWISYSDSLRSHIPVDLWTLLIQRPSLPPVCQGRSNGSWPPIVRHVRGLGDIQILKSYLLLVWTEWDTLYSPGVHEMEVSIRADFGGIRMWGHRDDLVKHLDHVQRQLDRGLECFKHHSPWISEAEIRKRKEQYGRLKNALLEVDKRAIETLTRTYPRFILFDRRTNPCVGRVQESHATFACALPLPFL